MSVSGIGTAGYPAAGYETRKIRRNNSGVDFANRIAGSVSRNTSESRAKANTIFGQDNYVGGNAADIYGIGVYSRKDISAPQELNLPIETERYKIEDASYVEGVPSYEIVDKLTGRGLYIREDDPLMIQTDEKTGLEFVINMEQPFSCNVQMTGELKGLLDEIAGKRGIDLQKVPMQGGLTVNQDPKTGLRYLSIQGNEAKGVSVIITSEKDIETLNKLADEFQKYPVSSQRETAGLYALLEISGNLKREKDGFTLLTPSGITYIPYNGDSDKAWEIDISSSDYSAARKYFAIGIEASNSYTWLSKINSAKLLENDTKLLNHFSNRRVLADEGKEQASSQKSESKTEIIVKPDGSRVLVMTMSIGGMETTMSLEISKPTEAPNENSEHDTNNTPTAENDTVSNEMSNVSSEA